MATKSVKEASAQPARPAQSPAIAGWLFPGYLLVIFAGFFLLMAPGAMTAGQEMGQVRALFSAVNAATLTGFPQTTDIDKYQPLGQAVVFSLIICGSLFSLIIGGTAVKRILRLNYSDLWIVQAAIIAEIAAVGLGTFFLLFDKQQTLPHALFLAAASFGNAGLVLGPAPNPAAALTHLIVLPLITLGGLGICVLIELFDLARGKRDRLTDHTRAVLGMAACFYVGGTIVLAAVDFNRGLPLPQLVAHSAAAAVGSRTAGMDLASLSSLSRPAIWIVMILMTVGGASGGTAGGIKTNTLVELFRGISRALAGDRCGRSFAIAALWTAAYALCVVISMLLLLHQLPQSPADRILFNVISAAGNVGLTQEPLSPDPVSACVLSATMLIGRFGPMMILWWMAETTPDAQLAIG